MKKKNFIIVLIIIFILMLIPIPLKLKDGGSIEYRALLYNITKIHRINHQSSTGYEDGWKIKILGIQVYNKTNLYINVEKTEDYQFTVDPKTCLNCYKLVYEFDDGTKVFSSCSINYKAGNVEISLYDALNSKLITLKDLEVIEGLKIVKPPEENIFGCQDLIN